MRNEFKKSKYCPMCRMELFHGSEEHFYYAGGNAPEIKKAIKKIEKILKK
jgi:hypothetical protein